MNSNYSKILERFSMCTKIRDFSGQRKVKVERDIPTALDEAKKNSLYYVEAEIELVGLLQEKEFILFAKRMTERFAISKDFCGVSKVQMQIKHEKLDELTQRVRMLNVIKKERIR